MQRRHCRTPTRELIAATHVGNTTEEFAQAVSSWLASARHPKTNRPYTAMVYKPMLELLAYLSANGFKTFIVSGGGVDAAREWAYDRGASVGRLERALDEAAACRWVVVDVKQDWKQIYPDEARQ